jgi:hypothetical protein
LDENDQAKADYRVCRNFEFHDSSPKTDQIYRCPIAGRILREVFAFPEDREYNSTQAISPVKVCVHCMVASKGDYYEETASNSHVTRPDYLLPDFRGGENTPGAHQGPPPGSK